MIPSTIPAAFELQVGARPEAIAIEAAGRGMTYAQLDAESNRAAHRLGALGVEHGDTVGIMAQRGIETVVAILGTVKAGGAYVPLDPDSPTERICRQLRDARATAILGPLDLADRIVALRDRAEDRQLPVVVLDPELNAIAEESTSPLRPEIAPEDLYAVLFTSGSTGHPKGVALEHRNLLNLLRNAPELAPEPGEGALQICAPQFDVAAYEIWATLLSGARLVCLPPGRPDPKAVCRIVREHEITWSAMATGIFHQLAQSGPEELADMRIVLTGGEALQPRYARLFRAACPATRLFNIYGPTETTVLVCAHEVGEEVLSDDPIPVGRAVAEAQLHVLDENGKPVAPGERGELHVGGPGISRGYLHQPSLTAERYRENPFSVDGGRLYRSGDIVRRRADGAIEIFGRTDDQVKVRGYRVEPGEVEAQLAAHPAVRRGAVVAREDLPGHRRLVAYATLGDPNVTGADLRQHLQERLPPYMVPSAVVLLEQMPLNPNGKVDRIALPSPAREQPFDELLDAQATTMTIAGAATLEIVQEVFAEVLQLPAVGPEDDFIELGGDSLLAIQILVRLRDILNIELEIAAVFETRTPAGLAALASTAGAPVLPPLRPRSHSGSVRASDGQSKALTVSELAVESLPYQSQAMHRIVGALDISALERSLSEMVRRHEILRTTFKREQSVWVQNVHEPTPVHLVVEELSAEEAPELALEEHFARVVCATRLDPTQLPLARWSLARLAPDQHAFIALEHHVVHDGVSTALFLRELAELYRSELAKEELAPRHSGIQYRDFAVWQQEVLASAHGQRTLEYWREHLNALPAPLELPFDHPRPLRQTYRGGTLRLTLPSSLTDGLRARARACGASTFMVMLAAYGVLLARYGGAEEELVVGSGLANRRTLASEQLIGMVVNTVALRLELRGDPTVRELIERVRATTLEAHAYQDVPFERVVEHLAPERSANTAPLYQTLFSFHDAPVQTLSLPGATLIPRDALANGSAKADLSVIVVNRSRKPSPTTAHEAREPLAEEGLTVVWEYNSDLFERRTAERMLEHFHVLLEQVAADGEQTIASLRLEEERQLAQRSAGPTSAYERSATIAELFQARAAETPQAIAVSFDGETLSYTRLERWSNRLAHRLRAWGIGRGSRVAVCMDRSLEMIVALLAVAKAGAAYVPLDPEDPSERLHRHMQTLQISLVLTLGRHRNQIPGPVANLICVEDDLDLAREPDIPPISLATALDPAYVMFTSGSTGAPKGVEVPHRAIARLVRDPDYVELGPRETLLGLAPIAFDASTFEIWGALLNGGRLVLAPPGLPALGELADLIAREDIGTLWLTSGLFNRVVDDRPELLHHLRQLLTGGEVLSPDHVRRALAALPEEAVLVNGYGPTEATTFTCAHRMRPGEAVDGPIPIGRPIAGSRVYLLDAHGEPVPTGVTGQLWIGGDGVALGYVDAPALTAERFRRDPFSPDAEAQMYDSGDRARWRVDGTIEFLGRADRQLKIRGHRVEPGEIEETLRTHPAIADAFVIPLSPSATDRGLAAYLVTDPDGCDLTDEELRAHASQTLPAYAIPMAWNRLEHLPLTANGKVDTAALPVPETSLGEKNHSAEKARPDELERELVAIWQRTLDITDIHPDDDFFALGGHSLRAVELFDTIERRLGRRLPLTTIFEAPTVRGLARALREDGWRAAHGSLVTLTATGSRPPLFFVTAGDGNSVGYGALARNLGAEQPFYALQPRGIDGGAPLHSSVEAMAAHYLRAIRRMRPHGPYLLGGRCLGSLVAYEMARRLRADGQEVALLAVLDSSGPARHTRTLADGTPYDQFMNGALRRAEPPAELGDIFSAEGTQRLLQWLSEPVLSGPDGTPINRYVHEVYRVRSDVRDAYPDLTGQHARALVEWMWSSGRTEHALAEQLLPAPLDRRAATLARPGRLDRLRHTRARVSWRAAEAADLLLGKRRLDLAERRRERLRQASQLAWDEYRAGPYDGIVTLIRSEEYRTHALLDHWYGPETAGVVEHRVSGTHRSMLREPDVAALANCIGMLVDSITDGNDDLCPVPVPRSHLINM